MKSINLDIFFIETKQSKAHMKSKQNNKQKNCRDYSNERGSNKMSKSVINL